MVNPWISIEITPTFVVVTHMQNRFRRKTLRAALVAATLELDQEQRELNVQERRNG
ncbi:MAG: hypothetical protein ACYC6M_02945 [Terriglobales bacterium]